MKIFLDIGAHKGETLSCVFDPKYSFDTIYAFEPVKKLHAQLKKVAGERKKIVLLEYGLLNQNTIKKIYSPGTLAGSIFAGHQDVDKNLFELCQFVKASEWFEKNINKDDEVYVKLNCEGAEADILLDLLKSKEIFKIKNVMIDFDTRKVKGLESSEQDVLNKFKESDFKSYSLCEDVMIGPSTITRTQHWLDIAGANKTDSITQINQFFYWVKMVMLGKRQGYEWELKHFIKFHTPLFLLKRINARRS